MFCAQCGQWLADGEPACGRCGAPTRGTGIGPLPPASAGAAAAAPFPVAPAVQYAGFWRRFATLLVDGLVLFFPFAIVRVAFGLDALGTPNDYEIPNYWSATFVNLTLWGLYCTLLESSAAQGTLGQQLLGIRVCDARLRRISLLRACGRFVAQWMSILTCGLGYLVNLWTKKRQTFHDLVTGCELARAGSLPAAGPPRGGNS